MIDRSSVSSLDLTCDYVDLSSLKTEFITTISHEVRTPLSVILLAVELLKLHGQDCSTVQRETYLMQIHHAANEIKTCFNAALPTIDGDLA